MLPGCAGALPEGARGRRFHAVQRRLPRYKGRAPHHPVALRATDRGENRFCYLDVRRTGRRSAGRRAATLGLCQRGDFLMSDLMEQTVERLVERVGSTYYGKYRGIVTDIDDPENRCRIRATVPAVLIDHPCGWAMPAAPFAGDGHGFVMLPKVGSGVWIEFEAGQLDSPIWSGAWWAKGQRP